MPRKHAAGAGGRRGERPMEDQDRPAVLALSRAWAEEDITYGYFANGENELDNYRCWVAEVGSKVRVCSQASIALRKSSGSLLAHQRSK